MGSGLESAERGSDMVVVVVVMAVVVMMIEDTVT